MHGNRIRLRELRFLFCHGVVLVSNMDNMIVDILNSQLNERFWDGLPCTEGQKRKYQVRAPAVPNTVDEIPSTKRKMDKEPAGGCASEMVTAHNAAILGLVESIKILTEKVERIDVSVAEKEQVNCLKNKADVNFLLM
ncbi:hypothetical protein F2Q69_00021642 [Brassica cretica]|uniref:Uncharacterized protein n=1 Tax=Brassica cretica TaxID=69181 RepID=A0A8S9QF05_BRACR|nr:hypothetical protein F2Q69_00021642 [Brassica cretica]